MNQNEDYYNITKNGHTHILSDRIPVKWKEIIILPIILFVPLFYWVGWFPGLVAGFIAGVGYALYRYAASIKYKEVHIDEQTGKMVLFNLYKERITDEEVVTEKYDPKNVVFKELTRSGNTKFLMTYKTHRDTDLLIIKTKKDKELLKAYFTDQIIIHNRPK